MSAETLNTLFMLLGFGCAAGALWIGMDLLFGPMTDDEEEEAG